MAALYNDGTVVYGSMSVKVRQVNGTDQRGTANYVLDNLTINRPTKAVDRTNELGEPSGSVGIADFVTGSATSQIADTGTTNPEIQNGDRIFFDGTDNAHLVGTTDEKFFITSVSRAMTKDGEVKLNLNLKKQYGA